MKRQLSMLRLLIGFTLIFAQTNLFADAQILSLTPSTVRVALGQSFFTHLTWRVATNVPPASITSNKGEFRLGSENGVVLASVNTTLSRNAPDTAPVTFDEPLRIPADLIYSAFKAAASNQNQGVEIARIVYVRTFSDGDLPGTAVATIEITGPASAGFNIGRLALRFEDDAIEKVTEADQFLRAKVKMTHTGSGVIRGVWEAATPASTSGVPVYRPLALVREFLSAGGEKTLISPRLPTDQVGIHLVRFRLTDPALFDTEPTLRYFVQSPPAARQPVNLLSPAHLSLLGEETHFTWQPVSGVRAYQLELYESKLSLALPSDAASVDEPRTIEPPPGAGIPPSTGLLIPAGQTSVPLTLLNRTHLQSGRTYLWRVVAIGADGKIVGESPMQVIRVP